MRQFPTNRDEVSSLEGDERFYSAIGRFMVMFSNLEAVIRMMIAETINLDGKYRYTIMTHDFAMLCTIAGRVLPDGMKGGADAALRPIIGRLHELNTHRLRIAHGHWMGLGPKGVIHTSRQKLTPAKHYEDPLEIADLADQGDAVAIEIGTWYRNFAP
jgi:hypothetical protein